MKLREHPILGWFSHFLVAKFKKQGWDLIGPAADMGRGFFGCRYGES